MKRSGNWLAAGLAVGLACNATTNSGTGPEQTHFADLAPGFLPRQAVVLGTTYNFQIYIPVGYTPTRAWPVILYLHPSGEAGSDGVLPTLHGLGAYVRAHLSSFPAVVVFPQTPPYPGESTQFIPLSDSIAKTAFDLALREVRADSSRLYLTGASAGAFRSWRLAYQFPLLFAASVPIAGGIYAEYTPGQPGADPSTVYALVAQRLSHLPVWVFHGGADPSAPVAEDRKIVQAFQAVGSSIQYREYGGEGHNVWDVTYADPTVWDWLFAQHR